MYFHNPLMSLEAEVLLEGIIPWQSKCSMPIIGLFNFTIAEHQEDALDSNRY